MDIIIKDLKNKLKQKLTVEFPQLAWEYNNLTKDPMRGELVDDEFSVKVKNRLKWYGKYHEGMTVKEIVDTIFSIAESEHLKNRGFYLDGKEKNIVKLDNGKYIYFNFGKCDPNLNFLVNYNHLLDGIIYETDSMLNKQLNLDYTGDITFLKGRFFKSKKGSNFFDLTSNDKPHVLIKINWGGAFNNSRGIKTVPNDSIYYRCAKSNNGRMGVDYLILPIDYKTNYTLDDF